MPVWVTLLSVKRFVGTRVESLAEGEFETKVGAPSSERVVNTK